MEIVGMWFNFDPCGMVCAAITHMLLVYAQYVVTYVILLPWFEMSIQGMLHQIGASSLCTVCSYFFSACSAQIPCRFLMSA